MMRKKSTNNWLVPSSNAMAFAIHVRHFAVGTGKKKNKQTSSCSQVAYCLGWSIYKLANGWKSRDQGAVGTINVKIHLEVVVLQLSAKQKKALLKSHSHSSLFLAFRGAWRAAV